MKSDVKIPEVGESISEVTIGQWVKEDGAHVEMDDVICEIESEKATLELRADQAGELKILVQEGETISVGSKIAEINTDSKGETETEAKTKVKEEAPAPAKADEKKDEKKQVSVSPVAAKLLAEAGIDQGRVEGSGAGGRITKADAEQAIAKTESEVEEKAAVKEKEMTGEKAKGEVPEQPLRKPQPQVVEGNVSRIAEAGRGKRERTETRDKLSTLRKTLSRRLVAAKNETAMLTTFNEVDMSGIMAVRNKYKNDFQERYDIRLGFMSFFVRACCLALNEFPRVNARLEEDEIVYHNYCDISIAVAAPKGLVVPVIFDADLLSLAEIEKEVARLAEKARDNKLTIEEMSGGTFSITNGGVFGSLMSTPILNSPQSAILGMHKIEERPVVVDGQIVIRPMMYVAMSYDHRVIDGKESVSFLVRVKEYLEDPARMLLEV